VEFPGWGDPLSPTSTHVSPYYIEKTMEDTSVPNIVTAVLADYRGYDTMFETAVIFSAGIACLFLLRQMKRKKTDFRLYRHTATGIIFRIEKGGKLPPTAKEFERIDGLWTPYDLIIKTTGRFIIPFIQICPVCYCPRASQSWRGISRRRDPRSVLHTVCHIPRSSFST